MLTLYQNCNNIDTYSTLHQNININEPFGCINKSNYLIEENTKYFNSLLSDLVQKEKEIKDAKLLKRLIINSLDQNYYNKFALKFEERKQKLFSNNQNIGLDLIFYKVLKLINFFSLENFSFYFDSTEKISFDILNAANLDIYFTFFTDSLNRNENTMIIFRGNEIVFNDVLQYEEIFKIVATLGQSSFNKNLLSIEQNNYTNTFSIEHSECA